MHLSTQYCAGTLKFVYLSLKTQLGYAVLLFLGSPSNTVFQWCNVCVVTAQ